ncbi:hypothetical protein C1H46_007425 [Malus baccata]|uniref:Uncharacterized protein n=1 Tax=Malus baccata TaxID=106549 RepID=A0A540N7J6_MALBA|nr:hypothetical protein C1H46_007425 [Malus baccata]
MGSKIREDAGQVVKSLSKQGIDVYMLSGDKSNNGMLELPWVVVLELLVRCLLLCYWATDFHSYLMPWS